MVKLGAKEELINEVVEIVGHADRPQAEDSLDKKIIHDADMLTHMSACEDKNGVGDKEFLAKLEGLFITDAGCKLAKSVLIKTN